MPELGRAGSIADCRVGLDRRRAGLGAATISSFGPASISACGRSGRRGSPASSAGRRARRPRAWSDTSRPRSPGPSRRRPRPLAERSQRVGHVVGPGPPAKLSPPVTSVDAAGRADRRRAPGGDLHRRGKARVDVEVVDRLDPESPACASAAATQAASAGERSSVGPLGDELMVGRRRCGKNAGPERRAAIPARSAAALEQTTSAAAWLVWMFEFISFVYGIVTWRFSGVGDRIRFASRRLRGSRRAGCSAATAAKRCPELPERSRCSLRERPARHERRTRAAGSRRPARSGRRRSRPGGWARSRCRRSGPARSPPGWRGKAGIATLLARRASTRRSTRRHRSVPPRARLPRSARRRRRAARSASRRRCASARSPASPDAPADRLGEDPAGSGTGHETDSTTRSQPTAEPDSRRRRCAPARRRNAWRASRQDGARAGLAVAASLS